MAVTKIRVENRSAHLKYIALGNGQSVAVPPQEQGGIELSFNTEPEVAAFKRAIETSTVREWITSGELVIADTPKASAMPAPQRRAGREGE